jgi:hypothetical protein
MYTGPNIVRDGLVLCLDAANPKSWVADASTWYDVSGNGNDATANGSPSTLSGVRVPSISFDGTNDYFQITANETSLSFKNGQTVGILFKTSNNTTQRRNLWDQAYGGYGTWTQETTTRINHFHGTSGGNSSPYSALSTNADIPAGEWNYLVSSRDTTNVTWYLNGKQYGQNSSYGVLTATTTNNIRIGLGYTNYYWIGNIALVQAYNRGLTADEVTQNYNTLKSKFI